MYGRVVALYDGSVHADRALEAATQIAKRFDSELIVLTVVPIRPSFGEVPGYPAKAEEREIEGYRTAVERAADRAKKAGAHRVHAEVREGGVVEEILTYLEAHPPDLVLVGDRGQSTSRRLMLGSVSEALVHHAPCPVLVEKKRRPATRQ